MLTLLCVCLVAVLAGILSPTARRVIGWTAAALLAVLVVGVAIVVGMAMHEVSRAKETSERIAYREVRIDDLQLTGTSRATYRLRGVVRNLSTRYTLTNVRFELIVEDCVAVQCHEQARGHAEIRRHVVPNETSEFFIDDLVMPSIAPALGERRLSYHVWNTVGVP